MDSAELKISVIIPLQDGARFILQALDSVFAQTILPDEVIVADCGSSDDGPAIVAQCRAKRPPVLLQVPSGAPGAARKHALGEATGTLIALLDQNDIWYPDHLADLSRPFLDDIRNTLGWTSCDADEIAEDGRLVRRHALAGQGGASLALDRCLAEGIAVISSGCLLRRSAVEAVGGFDEQLSNMQIEDLLLRLFVHGYRNAYLEHACVQWRPVPGSGSVRDDLTADYMTYARKLLATFPDEPALKRFHASQSTAPRFLPMAVAAARSAMHGGDEGKVNRCLDDIAFLEQQRCSVYGHTASFRREPLITAIVPLYNGAAFIRPALLSILAQTLPADEIIVVDDGSTDAGPEIVIEIARSHPILLIRKKNGGQSSARNAGVDHAHGDLIAFLDQDDLWYPDHLAELVQPFRQSGTRSLGWSYSDLDEINEAGEMIARAILCRAKMAHPKRDLADCLRQDLFILPSACVISRAAFQRVGGFDERLSGYEDDDLFLRLFLAGYDNVYLPEALSQWRIYRISSSYSPRMAVSRAIYARMLIERFPDDPDLDRYYISDLIAPRFFRLMAKEFRKAMLMGTKEQQVAARANLTHIAGYLRLKQRLPVRLLLLPALRIPVLARFIMRYRSILLGILRGIRRSY
jgi:glycosyltransferase involved in cell wall biosynthesis